MDRIAQLGESGLSLNVPDSLPSGSDVGTMSLFGYSPLKYHTDGLRLRPPRKASN